MLSAKLFEDRIVMIESEEIEYKKTKFLFEILKPYASDRLTFLTPFECDDNFSRAC
jgi:ribosomal protein L4